MLARGVAVVRLDSTLRVAERRAGLARIEEGGPLIVLTTPETLESKDARPVFRAARPRLLCVDEAHCISEWGHEFRPEYGQLSCLRLHFPDRPIAAFTASATRR